MRELELIDRIRRGGGKLSGGVRVGIGDDCAVLRVRAGEEIVVTTDFSLESRHFRRDWHTPESAGWRCLARGLSDVAAMGARPVAAFLSLALPCGFDLAWVDGFLAGFRELGDHHHVSLAGGDTAEAPVEFILADITVVGAVPRGRALLRSGAVVGDAVYVTGALGGSALELEQMAAGIARIQGQRGHQSFPEPRVAVGQTLLRRGLARSCMDLSDGLSTDLAHLSEASGVGIELESVPIASGASPAQALHGGEDYELVFTADASLRMPAKLAGVAISRIGTVVAEPGVRFQGEPLLPGGWQHFE